MKRPFYRVMEWAVRTVVFAFFDYRCIGREKIPPTGGAILACTHQSHLDPVMVAAPVDRKVGFVARSTLFASRMFGWFISRLGAAAFDRENSGPGELRALLEGLRAGGALVFFPEGTRSGDGEIGRLRPGIGLLATRSGAAVVPVAVDGTYRCWPRWRKFFRPGRVRVVYGDPVRFGRNADRTEVLRDLDRRLRAAWSAARDAC